MLHRARFFSVCGFAIALAACGGRIAPSDDASPTVAALDSAPETSGGEDPLAYLAAACAAQPSFEPRDTTSEAALASSLTGAWVLCPAALALPDPLFGSAAHVGVELFALGGARPLFVEGSGLAAGSASFAWRTTGPRTFELFSTSSAARTYDVTLSADGGSARVTRRDLGDTLYALVRAK